MQALVIDTGENKQLATMLATKAGYSIPVLLDNDAKVAISYSPEGVLPDLRRSEIAIAANLIIDPEGKIQFFALLDSKNFDARLLALQRRLDFLLEERRQKSAK